MGTSPLTRGQPHFHPPGDPHRGNIPAYAGTTLVLISAVFAWTEHPRLRGDNPAQPWVVYYAGGTSPLTRGQLNSSAWHIPDNRNIPAYAGTTDCQGVSARVCQEHPRLRGDNARHLPTGYQAPGTSPLTRGQPTLVCSVDGRRRNIPAYAGTTARPNRILIAEKEHPRLRGDNRRVLRV